MCNLITKKKVVSRSYYLNSCAVQKVDQVKYLGVTFTATLDWTSHVDLITAKASRLIHFFQRNFSDAPQTLKETLYITNVRPILEYACVSWDPFTNVLKEKLERVQKRAARFVTGNYDFRIRSSGILQALGWEPLCGRRKVQRLKFLYNIYHGKTGLNKERYLKTPSYMSERKDHLYKIREYTCRLNVLKYSFFPNSISDWNALKIPIFSDSNFLTAIETAF